MHRAACKSEVGDHTQWSTMMIGLWCACVVIACFVECFNQRGRRTLVSALISLPILVTRLVSHTIFSSINGKCVRHGAEYAPRMRTRALVIMCRPPATLSAISCSFHACDVCLVSGTEYCLFSHAKNRRVQPCTIKFVCIFSLN